MQKIKIPLKSQNQHIKVKTIENGTLKLRLNQTVIFENCKIDMLRIIKSNNSSVYFKNCEIRYLFIDDYVNIIEIDNCKIGCFVMAGRVNTVKIKNNSNVENLRKFSNKYLALVVENSYIKKILWIYNEVNIKTLNSKIGSVEFRYAILSADSCDGVFKNTYLYNCNIFDIKNFDFGYLHITPISSILLANWGDLSPKLTALCMAYDAQNHPDPEKFIKWANGTGPCPYTEYTIKRAINFVEKQRLWDSNLIKKPINTIDLIKQLFREKNVKAKFVVK